MALVKCKICGEEIDEDIHKCPRCDSLGPKRGKLIKGILLAVLLLVMIGFGVSFYLQQDQVERPYEEIVQERLDEKLEQRALTAALLLRSNIANPATMKLEMVKSNADGSVLCFEYLEQDGLGKQKKSFAAFVDGEMDQTSAGWKLFCSGKGLHPIKLKSPSL